MKHLIMVLMLAFLALPAKADFWNGHDLFSRIDSPDDPSWYESRGYILGVSDSLQGILHCLPETANLGQVVAEVRRALHERSGERHKKATVFVAHALQSKWPCPVDSTPPRR
jgi:hypothetical protein